MKKRTKLDYIKEDFSVIMEPIPEIMDILKDLKGKNFHNTLKQMSANLGKKWVDSDYVDFSYYYEDIYLMECCWTYFISSKAAIENSIKYFDSIGVNPLKWEVVDVFSGAGLTSKLMIEAGYNVTSTNMVLEQVRATDRLLKHHKLKLKSNFLTTPNNLNVKFDIVMCLESIEHFEHPMVITEDIIKLVNDGGYLVETTSFNSPQHYGHFPTYYINGEKVSGITASRRVHNRIREDFEQVFSGWNGLPRIWRKK